MFLLQRVVAPKRTVRAPNMIKRTTWCLKSCRSEIQAKIEAEIAFKYST